MCRRCRRARALDGTACSHHRHVMHHLDFELDRDYIELNQLLKLSGLCDSGGSGKAIVASGSVNVDGQRELRKTCKIHANQVVQVGDIEIRVVARA